MDNTLEFGVFCSHAGIDPKFADRERPSFDLSNMWTAERPSTDAKYNSSAMQQSTPWSEIGANGMSVGGPRLSFENIPAVPVAGILVCEPHLSSENVPTAPEMQAEKPRKK